MVHTHFVRILEMEEERIRLNHWLPFSMFNISLVNVKLA